VALAAAFALLAGAAGADGARITGAVLSLGALIPVVRMALDCGAGMAAVRRAVEPSSLSRAPEVRPAADESLESAA
jgi:hypothetical protein